MQSSVLPPVVPPPVNPTGQRNKGINTATKVLAIIHLVIGGLTLILGICSIVAIKHYWLNNSGVPIFAAIWIIVTGIIGLSSVRSVNNTCLRGTYMSFNIVSCIGAFIIMCMFSSAISHYNNCNKGIWLWSSKLCKDHVSEALGIYGTLVLLSVAEFAIALAASILCCKSNNCCCPGGTGGNIIISQQPQSAIVTQTYNPQGGYITQTQGGYPMHMNNPSSYTTPMQYPVANQQAGAYPQQQTTEKTSYPAPIYPNQPPPQYTE